jgi:UDP-N-acetylglucosamine--N-acetylmuramyl-(pentapeptide) pyrophosphoryl-undecaprenol N-acetylglucosamine transferase
MKIVVIGGHITPALATMDALTKMRDDIQFYFFGRKSTREGDTAVSAEYQLITKRKIPFYEIKTGRLQRSFTQHTIPSLFKIPHGLIQSFYYLREIKPDVIVSYGGYVAVPVAIAGWILRIPVVTHEQTLIPGLANKIVARLSKRVALSFEETKKFYPFAHTIVVGNPIRAEIFEPKGVFKLHHHEKPVIYVTGGNQGAHKLNQFIFDNLKELLPRFIIIHQTGNAKLLKDDEISVQLRDRLPERYKSSYYPFSYIGPDAIGDVFAAADVIVGRSGINTICEIIALGKKALLIPVPQHSEQKFNAEYFKKNGFGEMSIQEELTPGLFISMIDLLLAHPLESHVLLQGQKIIRQDAAEVLAREIIYEAAR